MGPSSASMTEWTSLDHSEQVKNSEARSGLPFQDIEAAERLLCFICEGDHPLIC